MQTFEDWFNTKNFPDREALANLAKISNTSPPQKLIYITNLTLKKLYHPIRQMGMILNQSYYRLLLMFLKVLLFL